MDNLALAHYGIKGMRWGVRRTPAQLGHRTKPKATKKSRTSLKSKKDGESSDAKKKASKMTDDELREAINRLELEKRYKELARSLEPAKSNSGKKFVESVLKKSGENIATQFTTYAMGTIINKVAGSEIVNPKKGQKDK